MAGEAYIVEAVRTPVGRRGGALSQIHPADLGAHVLNALVDRAGIDPAMVDDVILGCVNQVGAQSLDLARTAWLSAGLPESVPGVTIDRQCGSSQQAAHFAAALVTSGIHDLVVAGGVEVMSMVPLGSSLTAGAELGYGHAFGGTGWGARYGEQPISQFVGAELVAAQWDLGRPELEELALRSHRLAGEAQDDGRFVREIAPWNGFAADEGIRRETTREQMAALEPLTEGGRVTAALASQISDGAAALLVASEDAITRYGLVPRARFHSLTVVGSDPVLMLTGPIPATARALDRGGLSIKEIDLFEINEAFAPVVLAWLRETGAPLARTNVNGGAIALGHPLGATGARLLTSLLHELERTGGRFGLQTMCEGGGQANATIIERIG
jgi:acetyl-CoA C-acetyltransferase